MDINNTNLIGISSQSNPLVIVCTKKASGDFYIIELHFNGLLFSMQL